MQGSKEYRDIEKKIISEALRMHKSQKIIEAKKLYQKYLDMGFNDPKVLSNYGIICKQEGDIKKACLLFKTSISKYPSYPDAYINLGNLLIEQEKYIEAILYTQEAIRLDENNACAQNNYGTIMQKLNKHKQAEICFKKAIRLKANWELPYYNISTLYQDLGKLKEAEINAKLCLDINSDFAKCHYLLSTINPLYLYNSFGITLFSDGTKSNNKKKNLIYINFAKANIMHSKENFKDSAKYLKIANSIKLDVYKSDCQYHLEKTEALLKKEHESISKQKEEKHNNLNIFIVGMPRSGSTLVESILSLSKEVTALGEINIFEEAYLKWIDKDKNNDVALIDIYQEKISSLKIKTRATTNKWLYNYQYAGLIAKYFHNAKIIHCSRDPLDNILSMYRANFDKGSTYSSSIIDCAKVYLNQQEVMHYYKNKYSSQIYSLNYDQLVYSPRKHIKSLILWLKLDWDEAYLYPHLNKRLIKTASNVQVRKPINSKSVDGWRNYEKMLEPAIKFLENSR
tara:strand:+ start:2714 stop:4249 length:1536 start_codon:yes stop_codon:yes gene_type:complete